MANTNVDVAKKAEDEIRGIFSLLDGVDVDTIQTDGISMRLGNRVVKFSIDTSASLSIEDEVREEFRGKLRDKLQKIKDQVNSKISEMSSFVSNIKREFERKEKELNDKLKLAKPMPNVTFAHAQKGLSVVQGRNKNSMYWFVQGIYHPQYLDTKLLDPKYTKKMISNIVFCIQTEKDRVIEVSTRQPIGLDYFSHYHQSQPDCWGHYKPPRNFKSPDDIIAIAREAEIVLENINSKSIANSTPRGLPRQNTLSRHLVKDSTKTFKSPLSQEIKRTGITAEGRTGDDIWMTAT